VEERDIKEMQEGINAGEVTFVMKNGAKLSKFTEAMKGSYKNPIDIREKLAVCTRDFLSDGKRQEIYEAAMGIDRMDDIRELTRIIGAIGPDRP
jgi:hypothetical protein